MGTVTIEIKKEYVFTEVAKITSYVGAKTIEDTGLSYDRVFTTDDDRLLLDRFWKESKSTILEVCKRFVQSVTPAISPQEYDIKEVLSITLSMPPDYDTSLDSAVKESLIAFMVNNISSKWFAIANKGDASYYAEQAVLNATDASRKLYFRKKPTRVKPIKTN